MLSFVVVFHFHVFIAYAVAAFSSDPCIDNILFEVFFLIRR